MSLAPAFKAIVSVSGVAGVVGAASAPIFMSGGSSISTDKLNIVSCESSAADISMQSVSFGDKNSLNVCWLVEKAQGKENVQKVASEDSQELSSLFVQKWARSVESWKGDNSSPWLQQCTDSESGWVILAAEGSKEYLGMCNSVNQEGIPFIKKEVIVGGDPNSIELAVCSADCWSVEELSHSTKVFKKERADSWNRVNFYKN